MSLVWEGDRVANKMNRASARGIDATMSDCVRHGKSNHGAGAHAQRRFVTRTGELERSIRIQQQAKVRGDVVSGQWGSIGLIYARIMELGFQGPDDGETGYPYLRPAASEHYPSLPDRIKREFRRKTG